MSKSENRRQFLKNTSLLAISSALLPTDVLKAGTTSANQNDTQACDPTTLDFYGEGPFYTPNAPNIQNGQLAPANEPGTRMIISGRILNLDCTQAIQNATIDLWHANDAGAYDNSGYHLRGKTTTNSQGFYSFETIKPGKYLNGATYRPSHVHVKITATGFPTLTTQIYFAGDSSIASDAAASINSGQYDATHRIITLNNNQGVLEGTWDPVIDAQGSGLSTPDLHITKGMIYSASPNPFTDKVEIRYGVFNDARVGLAVYDINGSLVAKLEESSLKAEKYAAVWSPQGYLPKGSYFIALTINDLQVHYLKVIKQ